MSWIDRLQEAAFTTPATDEGGAVRITFTYEDVSRSVEKKTAAFNFPDADGIFIQDRGNSGRKYPIRAIFHGEDCDLEASVFEAALLQRGVGKLEHPIYGTVDVVAFGRISRRDDLKSAANQAIVEVVFWETTGAAYPSNQTDPASDIDAAVQSYNEKKAESFEDSGALSTATGRATFKNRYLGALGAVSSALEPIAAATDEVKAVFDNIADSIALSIDVLIGEPLVLASQTSILMQTPARSTATILSKFDGYSLLLDQILGGSAPTDPDAFNGSDLFAAGIMTGLVTSATNTQFDTKENTLNAAELLLEQFSKYTDWRDNTDPGIDTGEAYQQLQEAVAITAGFLVDVSFTLKREASIVLDRDKTIINVAAELYGSVDDDTLNTLINTNKLTGSEIIELPRGRTIVYYI